MWTRPPILLLGFWLLASQTPDALAQHEDHPRRTMQAFGSDTEFLKYLSALDRARPSRNHGVTETCADSVSIGAGIQEVVITGQVRDTAGKPIVQARISALSRCTTADSVGRYRLVVPAKVLRNRSNIRVLAERHPRYKMSI
jgi:hypothetical protein